MGFGLSFRVLSLCLLVAGCSDGAVMVAASKEPVKPVDVAIVRLGPDNIGQMAAPPPARVPSTLASAPLGDYQVGPGDALSVIVIDHPELLVPGAGTEQGYLVRRDGTFTYPFVGDVVATGRTVEDIRKDLVQRLATFFPDPQIDVRVAKYGSQRVVIGGAVGQPSIRVLEGLPLTVFDAVTSSGGLKENADVTRISLRRGGKEYRIDLDGYLADGLAANNPPLRAGDVIFVPTRKQDEAFVLGEVLRPSPVDLSRDPVTVTQAITRMGGLNLTRANASGVFVFRETNGKYTVYALDMSRPEGVLLGTRFVLRPNDVIYVTRAPLQKWNDTISRILPTINASGTAAAVEGRF